MTHLVAIDVSPAHAAMLEPYDGPCLENGWTSGTMLLDGSMRMPVLQLSDMARRRTKLDVCVLTCVQVVDVPGDHFSLLRQSPEDMQVMVGALQKALAPFGWHQYKPSGAHIAHSAADAAVGAVGDGQDLEAYLEKMGVDNATLRRCAPGHHICLTFRDVVEECLWQRVIQSTARQLTTIFGTSAEGPAKCKRKPWCSWDALLDLRVLPKY